MKNYSTRTYSTYYNCLLEKKSNYIVTYVTHSEGKFEELINNKYGVKIDVLGWGQKWNGYRDKSIGIIEYLKNTHDDEIVIYLDGLPMK